MLRAGGASWYFPSPQPELSSRGFSILHSTARSPGKAKLAAAKTSAAENAAAQDAAAREAADREALARELAEERKARFADVLESDAVGS